VHLVLLLAVGCIRYGAPAEDGDAPADTVVPSDDTGCPETACPDPPGAWTPTDVGWTLRLAIDEAGHPRPWGPTDTPSTLTVELRDPAHRCRVPYAIGPADLALAAHGGPKELRAFLVQAGLPFGVRVAADQVVDDLVRDDACATLDLDVADDLASIALTLVDGAAPRLLVGLGGEADPVVYGVTDELVPREAVGGGVIRLPFDVRTPTGPLHDLPAFVLRSVLTEDGSPAEDDDGYRFEDAATIRDGDRPAAGWLYAAAAYGITL
jgi:hypothetical protein